MHDEQGDNATNSGGTSERGQSRVGSNGKEIECSTKKLSGRGTTNDTKGDRNRDFDRNSILDDALFLVLALDENNNHKNKTCKSGELSKEAKKEYAKKQESKGYDREE